MRRKMTSRLWLCECEWFYTGEEVPVAVYREQPDRTRCHQMTTTCGWWRKEKRKENDET
jgi:hypothetical protein